MIQARTQPLTKYLSNVYSQNGEDGVLNYLISQLEKHFSKGIVVDVGAWDGQYLSNTKHLIDKGAAGLLIEGNSLRAKLAKELYEGNSRVIVVEKFIDPTLPLEKFLLIILKKKCSTFKYRHRW